MMQPLDFAQARRAAPPILDFVLPGLLAGTHGVVVGAGAAGKSWLALQTTISVAYGEDIWNLWGDEEDQPAQIAAGPAAYFSLEDPDVILRWRVSRLGTYLPREDTPERDARVIIQSLHGGGLRLAERRFGGDLVPHLPTLDAIARACEGVRLAGFDTLNRVAGASGLDENSNADMGALTWIIEQYITARSGAATFFCHHISKAAARNGEVDATSSRGAGATVDNARWSAVMTPANATEFGHIPTAERRRWVRVDAPKINYAPNGQERWLYRSDSGVLTRQGEPTLAVEDRPQRRRRTTDEEA